VRRGFSSGWWDDSKERTGERVEKEGRERRERSRKERGQEKDKKVEEARQGKPNCLWAQTKARVCEGGKRREGTNERTGKMDNLSQTHVVMAMCMDTHKKESCGGGHWWSTWTVGCGDDDYDTPNNPKHPNGPETKFSHHHHHHHQEDPPTQDYALSFIICLFAVAGRMISRDNGV